MKSQNDVTAAIVAAVYFCLHAEQEQSFVCVHAGLPPEAAAEKAQTSSSSWAISGRQAAMESRRARQMRLPR